MLSSQFGAGKTMILSERRCTDLQIERKGRLGVEKAAGLSNSSRTRTAERRRPSVSFSFRQPPNLTTPSPWRTNAENSSTCTQPPSFLESRPAVTDPKRALERQKETMP
jgi:hypothetical protein